MTDSEKLALIDFSEEKVGMGAAHALCVAIELVLESKGEDDES